MAVAKRPRGPKATASIVGRAAISQEDSIEPENRRVHTSRTEYWCYVVFCTSGLEMNKTDSNRLCTAWNGRVFGQLRGQVLISPSGIGTDGGALRQALTSMAWPSGVIHWGQREIPREIEVGLRAEQRADCALSALNFAGSQWTLIRDPVGGASGAGIVRRLREMEVLAPDRCEE